MRRLGLVPTCTVSVLATIHDYKIAHKAAVDYLRLVNYCEAKAFTRAIEWIDSDGSRIKVELQAPYRAEALIQCNSLSVPKNSLTLGKRSPTLLGSTASRHC